MQKERRVVDRVLQLWREMAHGGRVPRRDPSSEYKITDGGTSNGVLSSTLNPTSTATPPISPVGSTLTAGSTGFLVTRAGTWTFGAKTGPGGNQILLNGSPAGTGYGVDLEVVNGGNMYTKNASGTWYEWKGTSWTLTRVPADPPSSLANRTYVVTSGSVSLDGPAPV